MEAAQIQKFKGDCLTTPKQIGNKVLLPYLSTGELADAINLSIFLQRPLLLMGEPGCGKTRLAEAVAYELYGDDFQNFYFRWDIKSTSKAKEGIYRYDALQRLRDVQLKKETELEKAQASKTAIIHQYISKGPLGEAFEKSTKSKPTILLIDEIDKGEIDFPNDLLLELDSNEFVIDETGERIVAEYPPIIFITSNNEKELPSAFLRRCLFHYIEFPKKDMLTKILHCNFDINESKEASAVVNKAVEAFLLIREKMEEMLGYAEKQISTSELIDWFHVINHHFYHGDNLDEITIDKTLDEMIQSLEETGRSAIPFHQVLLKNWESHIHLLAKIDDRE